MTIRLLTPENLFWSLPACHSARRAFLPKVAESTTDANGLFSSIQVANQFKPRKATRKKPSAPPPLHSIFLGYHFQHLVELAVVDSKPSYGETVASVDWPWIQNLQTIGTPSNSFKGYFMESEIFLPMYYLMLLTVTVLLFSITVRLKEIYVNKTVEGETHRHPPFWWRK